VAWHNEKERPEPPGRWIFPSMIAPGGNRGTKVLSVKTIPNHSASAGNSLLVAPVSGPCRLIVTRPSHLAMTIVKKTVEIEFREPARSLWVDQMRSTKGESESRSLKSGNMEVGNLPGRILLPELWNCRRLYHIGECFCLNFRSGVSACTLAAVSQEPREAAGARQASFAMAGFPATCLRRRRQQGKASNSPGWAGQCAPARRWAGVGRERRARLESGDGLPSPCGQRRSLQGCGPRSSTTSGWFRGTAGHR